jgi:CheY-like chemotaxis protein
VDAATSLALLLESVGHEICVTHDGAAALAALEHFASDVILLDIGLPGMVGYRVAQSIRQRFPNLTSRLYAMTGYGRTEDRQLALAAGFDDHLTKPVDPERLLRLIAEPESRHGLPENEGKPHYAAPPLWRPGAWITSTGQ